MYYFFAGMSCLGAIVAATIGNAWWAVGFTVLTVILIAEGNSQR